MPNWPRLRLGVSRRIEFLDAINIGNYHIMSLVVAVFYKQWTTIWERKSNNLFLDKRKSPCYFCIVKH